MWNVASYSFNGRYSVVKYHRSPRALIESSDHDPAQVTKRFSLVLLDPPPAALNGGRCPIHRRRIAVAAHWNSVGKKKKNEKTSKKKRVQNATNSPPFITRWAGTRPQFSLISSISRGRVCVCVCVCVFQHFGNSSENATGSPVLTRTALILEYAALNKQRICYWWRR